VGECAATQVVKLIFNIAVPDVDNILLFTGEGMLGHHLVNGCSFLAAVYVVSKILCQKDGVHKLIGQDL